MYYEGWGGQGGIRTHGTFVRRFSRPFPSTARTPVLCFHVHQEALSSIPDAQALIILHVLVRK